MRNFIAVLKDSFREAVDGALIWVMLILSAIAIVAIASVSFEAAAPQAAFQKNVQEFNKAFRLRGTDSVELGTRSKFGDQEVTRPMTVLYGVADVQKTEAGSGVTGTYTFRLSVNKPSTVVPTQDWNWGRAFSNLLSKDEFRTLVAAWAADPPQEQVYLVKIPKVTLESTGNGDNTLKQTSKATEIPVPKLVPVGMTADEYKATLPDGSGYVAFTAPDVQAASLKAVDSATMIEFLKQQFKLHAGVDDVDITRVPDVKEPEYRFDVTARVTGIPKGWSYTTMALFGAFTIRGPGGSEIGKAIIIVQDLLINTIGATIIFAVSVILTSFFIPNMLRKGAVDLVIVKPISRWQLLLYKYIGGLTFVFLIISFTIVGVWLALWFRSGVMNPSFLLSIPILTFTFAVIYAVSMLVAVYTRSAIAAIAVALLFMVFVWVVGLTKSLCDISRNLPGVGAPTTPEWLNTTADVLNAGLPRYNDLLKLNSREMSRDVLTPADLRREGRMIYPSWGVAIGISCAWIAGLYLLSYWRFATRDP